MLSVHFINGTKAVMDMQVRAVSVDRDGTATFRNGMGIALVIYEVEAVRDITHQRSLVRSDRLRLPLASRRSRDITPTKKGITK